MKITLYNIKKGIRYLKHYGWKEFKIRLSEKREPDEISYIDWKQKHSVTQEELSRQKFLYKKWLAEGKAPLVSIVLNADKSECGEVCKGTEPEDRLLASLEKQTYQNYEICRCFDKEVCKGEFVAALNQNDELEPNALFEMVEVILKAKEHHEVDGLNFGVKSSEDVASIQSGVHWNDSKSKYRESGEIDIVYSDEDMENSEGKIEPMFKSDFDLDFFYAKNYLGNVTLVRKDLLEVCNASMYDAVQKAGRIVHVPKVLCHSKTHGKSISEATETVSLRKSYKAKQTPLVSIIIPNKDELDSLKKCIDSIKKSTYENCEIIVVENNSTSDEIFEYYKTIATNNSDGSIPELANYDKSVSEGSYSNVTKIDVVTWKPQNAGFNYSAINNYGAKFASGSYLLLLNNDIEIITPDWIEKMLDICSRDEVGIVGGKLYYPDDTIQHAGIVVGVGGHARGIGSNMLTGLSRYDESHWDKTHVIRECSAVTAACLMIKKSVFDEVGGFEEYLTVAFNDVDLCLKVRKKGYLIVFNPKVEAYHYESKSRGQEDTDEKVRRFQTEIEYMRTEWNDILRYGDPYYNPGYSRVKNDYSLNGMS